MSNDATNRKISESESEHEVEVHFEPVVSLPEVKISTNEENELELIKLRAKLFRYHIPEKEDETPEWKERGTGEVKLLQHKENKSVRVVMRRDKTLKICANHYITPYTELKPSAGSNRAWVWCVPADYTFEIAQSECLAIRFATPELAQQWKDKFEEAKELLKNECSLYKDSFTEEEEEEDSLNESTETDDKKENDNEKIKNDKDKVIEKIAELSVTK